MQPHIGYGLVLTTEEYLEVIRQREGRSTLMSLAKKLLKDQGKKMTPEKQEKLKENSNKFFLHELNFLEYFPLGLSVTPMKGDTHIFTGSSVPFNTGYQRSDIFYKIEDIFTREEQRELKEKLEEYGFPVKKCQFYFGLNIIEEMKPLEDED